MKTPLSSSESMRCNKYLSQSIIRFLANGSSKVTHQDLIKSHPHIFNPIFQSRKKTNSLFLYGTNEITYEEFNDIISSIPTIYSANVINEIFKDYFCGHDKSKADLKKLSKFLNEMGMNIQTEEDMKILEMVLDKDKDGAVSLKDIMNGIPTYKVKNEEMIVSKHMEDLAKKKAKNGEKVVPSVSLMACIKQNKRSPSPELRASKLSEK